MKFPLPAAAAATGAAQAQIGTPVIRRGVATRVDLAILSRTPPTPPNALGSRSPVSAFGPFATRLLPHGGWVQ